MKAFEAQIYESGVEIFPYIFLNVYDWEKPDPFIGLGWGTKIYPPKLFSRIEDKKLMEMEDSAVDFLASSSSGKIECNNFSMAEPEEKMLVLWSIGNVSTFITHKHKNLVLQIGRYPTFSNGDIVDSFYKHMAILAVLPTDGGGIEAIGQYHNTNCRQAMLKTLQGEIQIDFS